MKTFILKDQKRNESLCTHPPQNKHDDTENRGEQKNHTEERPIKTTGHKSKIKVWQKEFSSATKTAVINSIRNNDFCDFSVDLHNVISESFSFSDFYGSSYVAWRWILLHHDLAQFSGYFDVQHAQRWKHTHQALYFWSPYAWRQLSSRQKACELQLEW